MKKLMTIALTGSVLVGCGPRIVQVVEPGSMVGTSTEAVIGEAHAEGVRERERLAEEAGRARVDAMATCEPAVCDAISRGEMALGMSQTQVLAATRTTPDAWDIRSSEMGSVMAPRTGSAAPSDGVSEIAFVSLQGGRVIGYTYRESQGFRTVTSPEHATASGRAAAQADALLAEGDRAMTAGAMDRALNLYDRADVLRPGDAETTLRIAKILDIQERPLEALMRYQLFLHQLDIERIDAQGRAAGHMAEAIAQARQRIIYLERYR